MPSLTSSCHRIAQAALLLVAFVVPLSAEPWRSPVLGMDRIVIDKDGDAAALPAAVQARLGENFVEYESFVVVHLPRREAQELSRTAREHGLPVLQQGGPSLYLPMQTIHLPSIQGQEAVTRERSRPVAGLFLVQFAYPILETWVAELADCEVERLADLGNDAMLVRAPSHEAIQRCAVARYLSWTDAFRTTDRLAPGMPANAEGAYSLELRGTDLDNALAWLPAGVELLDSHAEGGRVLLRVRTDREGLAALAASDAPLLSILPDDAEGGLLDERQGQVLAGNHNGTAVTSPGYTAWLSSKNLFSSTNQPTVAFWDSGYDDGSGWLGAHHPDLEYPERMLSTWDFVNGQEAVVDRSGHGSMVAGIIAGGGVAANGTDAQGFARGLGIAPRASLTAVKIFDYDPACGLIRIYHQIEKLQAAFNFTRNYPNGMDKAVISNHSWDDGSTSYSARAQLFDQRVVDANSDLPGEQPLTAVCGIGNDGPADKTARAPSVAKNVIAVGSTESYRPSNQRGAPPLACTNGKPTLEVSHIGKISAFSSRGENFGPATGVPIDNQRVKPDLVAPGGRVFSTVPFQSAATYVCQSPCQSIGPILRPATTRTVTAPALPRPWWPAPRRSYTSAFATRA